MKLSPLLVGVFLFFVYQGYAQQGKEGAKTISTQNTIVNEYTTLTADASSGNTFIKVNNSNLNTNNRFAGPLAKGDLLLIIQMQGATIYATPTDSTWGAITAYNNCGMYEFTEVSSVPDAFTININCTLKNNYTATGNVEVIRVPRFTTLTVNDTLTGQAWYGNGTATGGVVAAEVQNGVTITSAISASALGFRGGVVANSASIQVTDTFAAANVGYGGEKGEGIAGFEADYNAYGGMYGRGAPANGGGGGNSWNDGGAGGANAGDTGKWTGNGNPDVSTANYIQAWNLEYNGFANSTSSGGGRGGYSSCNVAQDPLTDGPAHANWGTSGTLWGGRNNDGGKGGRPLDYSTGRLFLGGGGGAGHEDNFHAGNGGAGGGLIYLLSYGTITGSGSIISNGQNGFPNAQLQGDGPGGAGAGGTIILNSSGAISGISVDANGGTGGLQTITAVEAEGPGGGGSGGYIAISNGAITTQATGGANGTTSSSLIALFPPNGATSGANGSANNTVAPLLFSSLIVNAGKPATICIGQSTALYGTGGDSTVTTYAWIPSAGLSNTNTTHPIASPTITTTYTLTATNSACPGEDSVVITVIPKVVFAPVDSSSICPGKSTSLNPNSVTSYSYTWNPSSGLSCANCPNPSANPSASATYTVIATNNYCSDTAQSIVTVLPLPTLTLTDTTICFGEPTTLYPVTNGTLIWLPATNLNCTSCNNPQVTPTANQTYTITASLGTCSVTDSLAVTVDQFFISAGTDTSIYNSASASLQASAAQEYIWSPSNSLSSPTISNPEARPSTTTTYSVTGFDSNGCSATSEVVVLVNDPCKLPAVPNAFSPNGDGKNDIFKMLNPYANKLVVFSIYNRWGQLVFRTTDLNQGWDGNFNGKPEPVDSYVYYIEIICQGENVSYKGNVTLLR